MLFPMKWSKLSEHQIRKAQAEGQLDNLKGAGKPLPPPGHGDFAEAAGFRIMAEAGALPQEVELRKALKAQAQKLAATTDPAERKREMAAFADLQQKLAIQEEARRKFYSTR
jgi:hypothetical protein